MRLFSWIVLVPVALAVIAFSVSNRETVVLDLWPLPFTSRPVPVFALVLSGVLVGFVWGGFSSWFADGKARRRARAEARRAEAAERELARARAKKPVPTGREERKVLPAPASDAAA